MKDHATPKHPGPWRFIRADSEFAGLVVAVGFLVMGLVSMPIATAFIVGAISLGLVIALLLRFTPRKFSRLIVGTLIVVAALVLGWAGRKPLRPRSVSSNALYVLPDNVRLGLFQSGYWLECWFDRPENVDRCKLTDANGKTVFEDVYVQCSGQPVPQIEMVFNIESMGRWVQSPDKKVNAPIVDVSYGRILFPRSLAEAEDYCR